MVGSIGLGAPAFYPLAAIASLAVADFDGDGHPDVLSQDRDGFTVCLLRGVGDGVEPGACVDAEHERDGIRETHTEKNSSFAAHTKTKIIAERVGGSDQRTLSQHDRRAK